MVKEVKGGPLNLGSVQLTAENLAKAEEFLNQATEVFKKTGELDSGTRELVKMAQRVVDHTTPAAIRERGTRAASGASSN